MFDITCFNNTCFENLILPVCLTIRTLNISNSQHKYDEIVKWYQDLADNNKYVVTYVPSIGKSVEGRDQPAVHITTNSDADMKIYFQCQIHASTLLLMLCLSIVS